MNDSIQNGFLIFSIIQSFLFAGLFLSKKNRINSDLIMLLWLLLFAVHCFLILISLNNESYKLLKILPINFSLLYGPLLFIYVNLITSKLQSLGKVGLWHLVPFFIFSIISLLLFQNVIFQKILASSGVLSGTAYCFFTFTLLKKHKKHISEQFSYKEKINLIWVSKLVKGLVLIWAGVFVLVILNRLFNIALSLNWFFVCIPLFISYIGYHGFKQQVIYSHHPVENFEVKQTEHSDIKPQNTNKPENEPGEGYKKSGLHADSMKAIYGKLQYAMQTNELYLHSNLSLQGLSEKLNIPQHHITQTLNSYAKHSFYNFVNSYRVNAFIERLKKGDAENFSLLGLAFDCGFNSKSSFNRIFKKFTNQTPSEFIKT
ncbi:MAG: helix-turn-helix domain-containing protein [Bacteroidales bacterium]|nr:helix-turn-helix domain-containing protein [Bacteroidales bacterium]